MATVTLWALLIAVIGFNLYLTKTKPAAPEALFTVLAHPLEAQVHENLAQTLWNSGNRPEASSEYAIAADLSPVLGVTTTEAAQNETNQIIYWKGVAAAHPDYRDAYIQLAALSYAQGNSTQTKMYLTTAAALDPNGKAVTNLLGFITKIIGN